VNSTPVTAVLTIAAGENNLPAILSAGGASNLLMKALKANAGDVFVGASGFAGAADGFPLSAGEGISLDITSPNKVKFRGTTNDKVAFITTAP
jgi:hypothetical protein